jgi:spore germination protein YaaH
MALNLPDHVNAGDTGHIADTNLIIDALAALDTRSAVFQPKCYVYLAPYKPVAEIQAMASTEVAARGKFWGVWWENFTINGSGVVTQLPVNGSNPMAYSAANKTTALSIATNLVVTLSGALDAGTQTMLANTTLRANTVAALKTHVQTNGFIGVNLNFEPVSLLTGAVLTNFKLFASELRTALDSIGPGLLMTWAGQLVWDPEVKANKPYFGVNYTGEVAMNQDAGGTAYAGNRGVNWNSATVNDFVAMGFDIVEMQAYDQFADFSTPPLFSITSMDQVADALDYQLSRIPASKAGIILGSYGIRAVEPYNWTALAASNNNLTRAQVTAFDATFYSTATRLGGFEYLNKVVSGYQIVAPDQRTMDSYYALCVNKRVQYVGFWLAGDYYFPSTR